MSRSANSIAVAEFWARLEHWKARTRSSPAACHIRYMTTYWGLCHPDGRLTFSRALLDQPAAFQDLVIVHELIHLKIHDHSEWFYRALSLYLPDHLAISRMAPEKPAELAMYRRVRDAAAGAAPWLSRPIAEIRRLTMSPPTS